MTRIYFLWYLSLSLCFYHTLSYLSLSHNLFLIFVGFTDHPVYLAVAGGGADGDSCAVNMDVRTYTPRFLRRVL